MKVKFTANAAGLLYRMLHRPDAIPDKPFKASDELAAAEVVKIGEWFLAPKTGFITKKGLDADGKEVINPPDDFKGQVQFVFNEKEISVKERFVARLKQLVKHYEDGGRQIQNCKAYEELRLALEGKTLEVEDVEEAEAPKADAPKA